MTPSLHAGPTAPARHPLAVKLAYTAWVAIWCHLWYRYGGCNQLWLCDFANSSRSRRCGQQPRAAVVAARCRGGAAGRMDDRLDGTPDPRLPPHRRDRVHVDVSKPWWLRALSLFHLGCCVPRRLRGGRLRPRGVWVQTALMTCVLLPASFLARTRGEKRQLVWGPFGKEQTWLPPASGSPCCSALSAGALLPPH